MVGAAKAAHRLGNAAGEAMKSYEPRDRFKQCPGCGEFDGDVLMATDDESEAEEWSESTNRAEAGQRVIEYVRVDR